MGSNPKDTKYLISHGHHVYADPNKIHIEELRWTRFRDRRNRSTTLTLNQTNHRTRLLQNHHSDPKRGLIMSFSIYVARAVIVYGPQRSAKSESKWKRLDHAMIYVDNGL
nr:hypothetical protein [Tanacetum cinerariifolium]